MTNATPREPDHVYKYFRGKWKELGFETSDTETGKHSNEFIIKDVDKKSIIELKELIFRQEKLLKNKSFLLKLKDKGKNIEEKYKCLQIALDIASRKDEKNINDSAVKDIDYIEWGGKSDPSTVKKHDEDLSIHNQTNDEDIETNPLQLLARHSVEFPLKTQNSSAEEDPADMIQKELEKLDIEDSEQDVKDATEENLDSNYFGAKLLQSLDEKQHEKKKLFRPYRRYKVSRSCILPKEEELKPTQFIPLDESLQLFREAHKTEKFKMRSEACASLSNTKPLGGASLPTKDYMNYRDRNETHHLLDEFEEEINDFYPESQSEEEDT